MMMGLHAPQFGAKYIFRGGSEQDIQRYVAAARQKGVVVDYAEEEGPNNASDWLIATTQEDVTQLQQQLVARKKSFAAYIQNIMQRVQTAGQASLQELGPNDLGEKRDVYRLKLPFHKFFDSLKHDDDNQAWEPHEWVEYVAENFLKKTPNPSIHPTEAFLLMVKNKFEPISGQLIHEPIDPKHLLQTIYQDVFRMQKVEREGWGKTLSTLKVTSPFNYVPADDKAESAITRGDFMVRLNEKHPKADLDAIEGLLNSFVTQGLLRAFNDADGKVATYEATTKGAKAALN